MFVTVLGAERIFCVLLEIAGVSCKDGIAVSALDLISFSHTLKYFQVPSASPNEYVGSLRKNNGFQTR